MQVSVYRYNPDLDEVPVMRDVEVELPEGRDLMVLDVLHLMKAITSSPCIFFSSNSAISASAFTFLVLASSYEDPIFTPPVLGILSPVVRFSVLSVVRFSVLLVVRFSEH